MDKIIDSLLRVFESNPGPFTFGLIVVIGVIFGGITSLIYAIRNNKPS